MTYANYRDFKARKPFRWWYDAIIDWRIANPGRPEYECARAMNVTGPWLSAIVNSDMFKARWAHRRQQFSTEIGEALVTKMGAAADKTLDILLETLDRKRDTIPFQALSDFADKTLARLGYGAPKQGPSVAVQVNGPNAQVAVAVSREDLAEAREALRRAEAARLTESTLPVFLPVPASGDEEGSNAPQLAPAA